MLRFWLLFPLVILLSACIAEDEPEASKVYITFYPPAKAFELECQDHSESEVCHFNSRFRLDGGDPISVSLKNRKDGVLARDGEDEFLKIKGTYRVSYYNSTQLDVYQDETFLSALTIGNDIANQHICMPIIKMQHWVRPTTFDSVLPEDSEQALNLVEQCRQLNAGVEVPASDTDDSSN